MEKIFKQAVADQSAYWDYIGKKYQCAGDKPVAPGKQCELYLDSKAYLGFIGRALDEVGALSGLDCPPSARDALPSKAAVSLGRDLAKTLPSPVEVSSEQRDQACEGVPKDQRRDFKGQPRADLQEEGEQSLLRQTGAAVAGAASGAAVGVWSVGKAVTDPRFPLNCAKGIIKQLVSELNGLADLALQIKDTAEIYWHAGLKTGVANLARAVMEIDPVALASELFWNVWGYFTEDFDNFSCYKTEIQGEKVCRLATKLALTYFTGKAFDPAFAVGNSAKLATSDLARSSTHIGAARIRGLITQNPEFMDDATTLFVQGMKKSHGKFVRDSGKGRKVIEKLKGARNWTARKTVDAGPGMSLETRDKNAQAQSEIEEMLKEREAVKKARSQ